MNTAMPAHSLLHWSGRVTSLLLFGLVMVIVIGHGGPPNVFGQPTPVEIEFAAIGLMLLGLVIGWLHEGLGGLLILLGLAAFNIVELAVNRRPASAAFPLICRARHSVSAKLAVWPDGEALRYGKCTSAMSLVRCQAYASGEKLCNRRI